LLSSVQDLERLLAKTTLGTATPRDLLALGKSLAQLPAIREMAQELESCRLGKELELVAEVREKLLTALSDQPPVDLADGGTIRPGYHPELDELRDISQNSRHYIAAIEARERTRTGISSLKVRFNNVFGFYLEISKANLSLVPEDYQRKQTLANAERFTTPELKELEAKVLSAEEKMLQLEREIFGELRAFAAHYTLSIKAAAQEVAELDVATTLAQVAVENRYKRPKFSQSGEMRIEGGRHPVVEKLVDRDSTRFIPNDLYLHSDKQYIGVSTGPNMGGKST